jgi:hypothetical protein
MTRGMFFSKKLYKIKNFNKEWFIVKTAVEETTFVLSSKNDVVEFIVLKFKMKMRRVTTYYLLKIIFPFTIIASITLFTFWLAPDSGKK